MTAPAWQPTPSAGLYTYNAEGHTVPACATGYTVSDDGLTYTVTLREGLKWSDGSDLTAADFEYAWKRAAATATAADYGYMFAGFAGYPDELNVTAKDATTFEFVLTAPCAYIEDLMAFPTFYPVKQAAVEAYKDWQTSPGGWCQDAGFVSNGAFVCTEWNHDTSMTYEKNPYWYDADKVTVNKLQFMLSADDTAIYSAYNAGDVDFIDTVPTNEIASLKDVNPEFHIIDALGTYYAAFNCKSALFADKTPEQAACMREAFSILIDRDYIIENVAQCGQKPANSFIPYGMADGNGGIFKTDLVEQGYFDPFAINNDYEGTVEKARTLLKAAGYKFGDDGMLSAETPISLEYLTNEATSHVKIAEAMQQDLAAIGIDMTIKQCDWNVFLQERKNGNFDFAREGWIADFNDPINMLEMWITSSGNNDCQYRPLIRVNYSTIQPFKAGAMPRPSLSKNPRVDKGPQPLMFNPALTTQGELPRSGKRRPPGGCASERMKTQRFSYFADFAARRPAAAGQFRPVSRGGTSCFLREAKPVKLKKVAFSHFFDTLRPGLCSGLLYRKTPEIFS